MEEIRKEIFESEEEARKFLDRVYCQVDTSRERGILNTLGNIKNIGLIKKSELEQAREIVCEGLEIHNDYKKQSNYFFKATQIYEKVNTELQAKYDKIKAWHQKFD